MNEPPSTEALKRNMSLVKYFFRKVIVRKQEKGLNTLRRIMRGRKQVLEFCFAMSTKTTRNARNYYERNIK